MIEISEKWDFLQTKWQKKLDTYNDVKYNSLISYKNITKCNKGKPLKGRNENE